jgi:hypothetical protein
VVQLAGLRVSWDELRKLILNPRTNKPITKTTLARVFAVELEQARAKLKALVSRGFHAALLRQEPWALRLALKNVLGFSLDTSAMSPVLDDEGQHPRRIQVTFVSPEPKQIEPPVLDVTPTAAPQPRSPDYQPGTRLEPPKPRTPTPFGWLE